jgi:coenzyme Q-binding protein COQ10
MPVHHERRRLPYSAAQLFDIVAAVDRYPEFLPWCLGARITRRWAGGFDAIVMIGFRMIRETFGSRVELERPHRIVTRETSGPFRRLKNNWRFTDLPEGGCEVDFHVDFEFRSRLLNRLIGILFHEAVRRMVAAFEGRARVLYGPGENTFARAASDRVASS